jgi:hypothetical protein
MALRDIKYGIAGFLLVGIFPLQAREMFGVTGVNARNLVFLVTILIYLLPRITTKMKFNEDKFPILKWMLLLFLLQFTFLLRIIIYSQYYEDMTLTNAINWIFLKPLQYHIILYIMFKVIKSERDIKFYLYIFYLSTLAGLMVLFYQYIILGYDSYSMVMWASKFAGHKNEFSVTAAVFTIICLSFCFNYKDKRLKYLGIFGSIISFVVLIFSLSRASWGGFLIGVLYLFYKTKSNRLILISIFLLFVIVQTPMFDLVINRLFGVGSNDFRVMAESRVETRWLPGIEGIRKSPILGGGPKYGFIEHNGYISTWNKLGIAGLIISIILYYQFFKTYSNLLKNSPSRSLGSSIALSGLACIFLLLFINIFTSFTPLKLAYIPATSLIFFLYISSWKLLLWEKQKRIIAGDLQ